MISAVAVVGLLLGSIRVRGVGIGSAGVLFAGILFGHFGASIDPQIAEFAKEFGLVLFVFTIGLQLGPGIFQLWKQQGLLLNSLAVAIVLQGLVLALACNWLLDLPGFTAAGLFSGATTNTPSLGAAQQAADAMGSMLQPETADSAELLASAYAVAYPGGIIGIIVTMLLIKVIFRVDVASECQQLKSNGYDREPILRRCIVMENRRLAGFEFGQIPGVEETGVRISRVKHANDTEVHPANSETKLHEGDVIQVVGTETALNRFEPLIGYASDLDLMESSGDARFRRVVVTEPAVLNRSLRELSIDHLFGATITRIRRSGVEMPARGSSRLQYGDVAHIVGDEESLDHATSFLGNSVKSLNETQFAPVFLGVGVGVVAGLIPLNLPGIPFPVKLGLAGGPLLAAIAFSLIGRVGRFVWYIPYSANLAMRELGIILFLACAGLGAGEKFYDTVVSGDGFSWMVAGFLVTTIPLLTTSFVARVMFKLNYLSICGVVSGSMTDPPALAFASALADSNAATTAYAAVYPLTMIMRIIAAQVIVYAIA